MKTFILILFIFFCVSSIYSADIDVSSMNNIQTVFSKYVDSIYSFHYFVDTYKDIPNAIDIHLFLSPLDTYYLSKDITGGTEPLDTSLFNFNFFYQLTPFQYLTVFSYLDGVFFAHEFSVIIDGYVKANLILGLRLNTEYFHLNYGIIHELEFTNITYPLYEGSYMLIYAMGYLTALAPVSIFADVFETGISLDMLKIDLDYVNILSLLNRNTLFNSTIVAINALKNEIFGLDILLQYAWLAEHYISGGCALEIGDEELKIRVVPILDLRTVLDELQVFLITPFFEIHTQCVINNWSSFPQLGIAGEVRPHPLLAFGLSLNDNYFTPFQDTLALVLYGRFHFDSSMDSF